NTMAPSERQRQAEAIAAELGKLGVAWVTSPLPLSPNHKLRFEVLNEHRQAVLEKIGGWGWSPALVQSGLRFCVQDYSAKPSSIYELALPAEQPTIVDDRRIPSSELADKEKKKAEVDILKYLGWKK